MTKFDPIKRGVSITNIRCLNYGEMIRISKPVPIKRFKTIEAYLVPLFLVPKIKDNKRVSMTAIRGTSLSFLADHPVITITCYRQPLIYLVSKSKFNQWRGIYAQTLR